MASRVRRVYWPAWREDWGGNEGTVLVHGISYSRTLCASRHVRKYRLETPGSEPDLPRWKQDDGDREDRRADEPHVRVEKWFSFGQAVQYVYETQSKPQDQLPFLIKLCSAPTQRAVQAEAPGL
jgi:hypothetical protein